MNQQARDVLRQAWLDGVPQIFNRRSDSKGGYCVAGVLWDLYHVSWHNYKEVSSCPVCGTTKYTNAGIPNHLLRTEVDLLVHYNNDHKFDFGKIAEIMPQDNE